MSVKRLILPLLILAPLVAVIVWFAERGLHVHPPSYTDYSPLTDPSALPMPEGAERILPPGAIPSINSPEFVDAAEALLGPDEPMILLEHGTEARAYSTILLNEYEIVNDEVGGEPLAITW